MRWPFLPIGRLVHDRAFVISLTLSVFFSLGIIYGIIVYFKSNQILVDRISNVTSVNPIAVTADQVRPISQMPIDAKHNIGGAVFSAYVANLEEICHDKMPSNMKSILIIENKSGATRALTAAEAKITPKTCAVLKKLDSSSNIYATSDKPIYNVPSQIEYFKLADGDWR